MVEQFPALLVTKIFVPRIRLPHLPRTHLHAVLDTGLTRKLILITAPAGAGKTSLAADWAAEQDSDLAVCWLSLDDGDNDPTRFMSYLLAAIQAHPRWRDFGAELLVALQSPQPPLLRHVLHTLVNLLAREVRDRLVLVLDDYHLIETQEVHETLAFLLDHLPSHVTLILLSRGEPPAPFPLARMRAKDDLYEIRAHLLRFSPDETRAFINDVLGLHLSPEAVSALETRTEGWVTGLQLAALALESLDQSAIARFIDTFTGSHRYVLDYLLEDVLAGQPDEVRRFLLHTAFLGRLCGDLCDAVTGEVDGVAPMDGAAMLEHIERAGLFLTAIDPERRWYRYHPLFADALLTRSSPAPALFQRAARWHAEHHFLEEAIDYALAGGDFDFAAALMMGAAAHVMQSGAVLTLLRWYRAFPPEVVREQPRLALQFGLAFALNGRWEEAETLLDRVTPHIQADILPGEVLLLGYLVAGYRQDASLLGEIAAQGERVVAAQGDKTVTIDPTTHLAISLLMSLGVLRGGLAAACQWMETAQILSERAGNTALALTAAFHHCRLRVFRGDLRHAYALCQDALAYAETVGGLALPIETLAHSSLGRIFIEWRDFDAADRHLAQAKAIAERSGFLTGNLSSVTVMQAEVLAGRGDVEGAKRTAAEAILLAERFDPPHEVAWLKTYQARVALMVGDVAAAKARARESEGLTLPPSLFYPAPIQAVTRAWVLYASRQFDAAAERLVKLTAEPRDLLSVEALALLALTRAAEGDHINASLTLAGALEMAEPENRVQVFLMLGMPMAKLLARFVGSHPDHVFAGALLAAFDAAPVMPDSALSVETLSDRELEVLRLIVAGATNDEIANSLTLAVSTVKWYINELYGKLGVKNRAQAIARAHALKLTD